jgi:hypothetical protein
MLVTKPLMGDCRHATLEAFEDAVGDTRAQGIRNTPSYGASEKNLEIQEQ